MPSRIKIRGIATPIPIFAPNGRPGSGSGIGDGDGINVPVKPIMTVTAELPVRVDMNGVLPGDNDVLVVTALLVVEVVITGVLVVRFVLEIMVVVVSGDTNRIVDSKVGAGASKVRFHFHWQIVLDEEPMFSA